MKPASSSGPLGSSLSCADFDLTVDPGEFVALLGPNGVGKTTLLRILASLARPSAGRVRIAGHELPGQAAAVRRKLGVVSHLPLLYGDLSAEENLRFYGRMYDLADVDGRTAEMLELVGLRARRRDLVREFSLRDAAEAGNRSRHAA